MDDKERQPASANAQEAREKGADLEYDTEGEAALAQSASPTDRKNAPQLEEN